MHVFQYDFDSVVNGDFGTVTDSCVCGQIANHREHPHHFRTSLDSPETCMCGLPSGAKPHEAKQELMFFLKWFVRGFEDVQFYDSAFADQRSNPGYEDGVVLGMKEKDNFDFGHAYNIGIMLFNARLKEETK